MLELEACLCIVRFNVTCQNYKILGPRALTLWPVALSLLTPLRARALEPWADQAFSITSGLELWLDASRETAARSADAPRLVEDGTIDVWHDASGNSRHLAQPFPAARPRFFYTP